MAQTERSLSQWDIYLDHAYELTYWDSAELKAWLNEKEKELGKRLSHYADQWHHRITLSSEGDGTAVSGKVRFSFPEQVYRRLAVADLLLYLQSREQKRLNDAHQTISLLTSKFEKPEIAFWTYYIRAHEAISYHDWGIDKATERFVKNVVRVWMDVILPLEEAHAVLNIPNIPVSIRDFSFSLPYLYENIANIILDKAIIECELPNIGSLGVIIRALEDRLSVHKGYSEKVKAVVNRMSGPKSDDYHLNYTVSYFEAEEYRFLTQNRLSEDGASAAAEEAFRKSRHYYELAFKWANTRQGKVAIISDYLNLFSFALSRLPEKEQLRDRSDFVSLTEQQGQVTIDEAMRLYEELTKPEIQDYDWVSYGFSSRENYLLAMHALWNSITELSLWSSYYHEKGISLHNIEYHFEEALRSKEALLSYLNFFERTIHGGYMEAIPENAYFNAAESAARMAGLERLFAPYSYGMTSGYRAFVRLLQYIEIFPYDPEAILQLAQHLNEMGKPDLYVKNLFPIAYRIKESGSIRNWQNRDRDDPATVSLEKLQQVIPEIILKANTINYLRGKGSRMVADGIIMRVREVQEKSRIILNNNDYNIPYKDFHKAKESLDRLVRQFSSKNAREKGQQQQKLMKEIKMLIGEIQKLEEVNNIMVHLPEYIEISQKIRNELAQKIDHPLHLLLRQFFHEEPLKEKYYFKSEELLLLSQGKERRSSPLSHEFISK